MLPSTEVVHFDAGPVLAVSKAARGRTLEPYLGHHASTCPHPHRTTPVPGGGKHSDANDVSADAPMALSSGVELPQSAMFEMNNTYYSFVLGKGVLTDCLLGSACK